MDMCPSRPRAVGREGGEGSVAQEFSDRVARVDRGATCEAVLEIDQLETPNLTFKDHCIAVAQ